MDPYNQNNDSYQSQEPVILKEKKSSSNALWYSILVILLLALVGWYAYSAGWFSPRGDSFEDSLEIADMQYNNDQGSNSELQSFVPISAARIDSDNSQFPPQKVVVVNGEFSNGCTELNEPVQFRDGNTFYITLDSTLVGEMCTQAIVPFEKHIPLSVANLPGGTYLVDINNGQYQLNFELPRTETINFDAGDTSGK